MSILTSLFFYGCTLTACVYCTYSQWMTPESSDVKYACSGSSVSFPWRYQMSYGESVSQIQWFYKDANTSKKLVAVRSHNVFLPTQEYSQRVSFVENAGIVLRQLKVEDSGNYSVKVDGRGVTTGSQFCLERNVIVQVFDGLPTNDGHLHVTLQDDVIFDKATQQWSLVLSCGYFTFIGQPAFPVEWLTPSGDILNSTTFEAGIFNLHLRSVALDGSYTCRVPQNYITSACLHGNEKATQASVHVNKVEARMMLMAAEIKALKQDKLRLERDIVKLNVSLRRQIEEAKTPLIGFNAQANAYQALWKPTHLKFRNILFQQNYRYSYGFSYSTGDFKAPLSGTYVFYFHTQSYGDDHYGNAQMMTRSGEICRAYIHVNDHGSCLAVVHLNVGEKVWVEPYDRGERRYFNERSTSFAGFLLSRD